MDIPDSGKSKCKGPKAGNHRIFSRKLSIAWWRQWSKVKLKAGSYRVCRVWLTMLRNLHVMPMGPLGVPGHKSDMIRSVFLEDHSGYMWRIDERSRVDSGKWNWVKEALVHETLPVKMLSVCGPGSWPQRLVLREQQQLPGPRTISFLKYICPTSISCSCSSLSVRQPDFGWGWKKKKRTANTTPLSMG